MTAITTEHAFAQREAGKAMEQIGWFIAVAATAFLVPYVLTSVLSLNVDLYYLFYFAISLAVLSAYVIATRLDIVTMLKRSWKLSLLLGLAAAAFVVWNVMARADSTPRPDGAYFAFQLGWRGVIYGFVDALLLTAFPSAVAFGLLRGDIGGFVRRATFAMITLVLTVMITATYHLGYEQYRYAGLPAPETGNVIISLPAIATANPAGSIVAHVAMHEAAVYHAYETDTFLPPEKSAD